MTLTAPDPATARSAVPVDANAPGLALATDGAGDLRLQVTGTWRMDRPLPEVAEVARLLDQAGQGARLGLDATGLADWDSGLVTFTAGVRALCRARGIDWVPEGLPEGLRALLERADGAHQAGQTSSPQAEAGESPYLAKLGQQVIDLLQATGEIIAFFGEVVLAARRFSFGQARYRPVELWLLVQQAGAEALPIVGLVSFLVGMILGYIGDTQLAQFGARIYVANLVGLAMVLQVGALITAIVLAGRTGAAYAAQLGTMQVNEEIDALRTLGLAPMDFLVLPRMLALILMTPLLALYADAFGILGGAFVGGTLGGITLTAYLVQTQQAIGWNHILQGLISATVYGAIVAASGCLRGMQCGRSAAAVGAATTSAVVTAIVFIVIAAAVLTVLFNAVGL